MTTALPPEVLAHIDDLNAKIRHHQRIAADLLVVLDPDSVGTEARRLAICAAVIAGYDVREGPCLCGCRVPIGLFEHAGEGVCHGCGTTIRVVLGKAVHAPAQDAPDSTTPRHP